MISLFLLIPSLVFAAENTLTPAEQKARWILLFDGKTMKHWEDPARKNPAGNAWNITPDGCLHTIPQPAITEDLFSTETYRDFELAFDWRISPAGNSGVKYRIQDHRYLLPRLPQEKFEASVQRTLVKGTAPRTPGAQDYVVGFEYQITDNDTNPDAMHAGPKHSTGALYDMVAPTNAAPKAVGDFNSSRIVVKGNHVEHWLNGVKVVDTMLNSPEAIAGIEKRWSGTPAVLEMLMKQPTTNTQISLQNHGDEAWFRNIKIRPR